MTPVLVTPTVHPAFILRGQEQLLDIVVQDLKRAKRLSEQGWQPADHLVLCTPEAGPEVVAEAYQLLCAWRAQRRPCAVDVETTGHDRAEAVDPIRCGLKTVAVSAHGTDVGVALPVGAALDANARWWLLQALRELCIDAGLPKIFHNVNFDSVVLERHGLPVRGPIYDTVILAHVVEPAIQHDLGFTAHLYLDTEAWKDDFREMEKSATLTDLLRYNAYDAVRSQQLLTPLSNVALERGLWPVVQAQTRWSSIARRMNIEGVPLHEPTRLEYGRRLAEKRDAGLTYCRQVANDSTLDLNKPAERMRYLYEVLRLPVRKYTKKTGKPSTSYKAVTDFLHDERVRQYVRWAESAHDRATFITGFGKKALSDRRYPPDWKVLHPTWNVTGQKGSRWSSNPNLSNVPAYLRSMVRAPPGYKCIMADEAQLEYRIIAALAGARRLIEIFNTPGADAHTEMARAVFGARFDGLPDETREALRTIVKRVVYALGYGAGVKKIVATLREDRRLPLDIRGLITFERVSEIYDGFFRANPEIAVWRQGLLDRVARFGYIEIPPLGRRRYFPSTDDRNMIFNWPVQTLGSDVVNLALVAIEDAMPDLAPLAHGHDAGLWMCRAERAERAKRVVDDKMHYRLDGPAGSVLLFGKADVVDAWYPKAKWPDPIAASGSSAACAA